MAASRFCSHCGASYPDNATFCPACGQAVDAPSAASRASTPSGAGTGQPLAPARSSNTLPLILLAALGLAFVVAGAWMLWPRGSTVANVTQASNTTMPASARTTTPLPSSTPSSTPTATAPPTSTAAPTDPPPPAEAQPAASTAANTQVSAVDGMVLVRVPAGEFVRGTSPESLAAMLALCPTCVAAGLEDQSPQRGVYLDEFWIDQTEVTNAQFAQFVAQTGYVTTAEQKHSSYVLNSSSGGFEEVPNANWRQPRGAGSDVTGQERAPVTQMSWDDATAYCNWVGRRLPTEAEWEKAARGVDGRLFPWGNEPPDAARLNFNLNLRWADMVGRYPAGASPYGAQDMAGNLWEWTADYFDEGYYANAPDHNPPGPAAGEGRTLRGGSWASEAKGELTYVTTTYRLWNYAYIRSDVLGFRCAVRNLPPTGVNAVATSQPSCALLPNGAFANLWSRYQSELGCAVTEGPRAIQDAEQPFQNGHMFWRGDVDVYYVVYDGGGATSGTWAQYPGKYNEGGTANCTEAAPSGLSKPVRGFGNVWCGLGGANAPIGWALDAERGFGAGQGVVRVQDFERGVIFQDSDGVNRNLVYVLFHNGPFIRLSP